MADHYRIVSLDGGGIRGILSSRLLERLEDARPGFLGDIDLIAGTSTGGILALALAAGHSPAEMSALYRSQGQRVFAEGVRNHLGDVDRLERPDYDSQPLERMLCGIFGDLRLGELQLKVLVSAFDLDSVVVTKSGVRSWKPKFFHNFEEEGSDDREQLVVDVAMRTAAVPTYFRIHQGFIDGGVVAGNPSMCALAQALDDATGGHTIAEIALLSIGTGVNPRYLDTPEEDWGFVQWAPHLLAIMFEGDSGIADYQCRRILGPRYVRLNPVLPRRIGLAAVDEIPLLEGIAEATSLDAAVEWLERYCP